MSTDKPRREHTRYLLWGGILVLALIGLGAELLLRAAPTVDRRDELRVEGVPPLGLPDAPSCTRRADDTTAAEIREAFAVGGRISSAQVYACPMAYDDLRVTFAGELVGELLPRRGGVWVQVNDDDYALRVGPVSGHRELRGFNSGLAVWLPDGLHERVEELGRPGVRGEVVLVSGRLRRADPADGGGITLRADSLEVLAAAVEVPAPLHVMQAIVAVILVVLAAGAATWAWVVRRE